MPALASDCPTLLFERRVMKHPPVFECVCLGVRWGACDLSP